MVLRVTDATTSLLRLPGGWRVSCSMNTIVIEEAPPGLNRSITGVVVLLATAACVAMFSLPLAGLLAATDSAWTDWLIALSFLAILLLVGSLVVPPAAGLVIPWRLSLTLGPQRTLVRGGGLGRLGPVRRRGRLIRIVVRPAYQRGDWGFQVRAEFAEGRPVLVMPPRILTASIREAENEGARVAEAIAACAGVPCARIGWEHHR